jgi:hypothetical protein
VDLLVLRSQVGQETFLDLVTVKGTRESQILRMRSRNNTVRHGFYERWRRRGKMMMMILILSSWK